MTKVVLVDFPKVGLRKFSTYGHRKYLTKVVLVDFPKVGLRKFSTCEHRKKLSEKVSHSRFSRITTSEIFSVCTKKKL